MIGKIIGVLLIVVMLFFAWEIVYDNRPGEPVELKTVSVVPETVELIDYGAVPVFADKLRFNHNIISYSISGACTEVRKEAMVSAFNLFAKKMKIISFYEISSDADIDVECSNDYISLGESLFAAGEGGPSRIINTSNFKTIEKGKILLYEDPRCDYPVVEMHELCHVFGFDHSLDPNNIMYNTSNCDQRISYDMVQLINDLYSVKPLADLSLVNIEAVQKGKYLDFNITILNEGMVSVDGTDLTIVVNGKDLQTMDVAEIEIGYGQTLRATNVRLPTRDLEEINFIVDRENNVPELNEENNVAQLLSDS